MLNKKLEKQDIKYKVRGFSDNHIIQVDFDIWMNELVCSECGMDYPPFTQRGRECSSCHSQKPFVRRYKYYESKGE